MVLEFVFLLGKKLALPSVLCQNHSFSAVEIEVDAKAIFILL